MLPDDLDGLADELEERRRLEAAEARCGFCEAAPQLYFGDPVRHDRSCPCNPVAGRLRQLLHRQPSP